MNKEKEIANYIYENLKKDIKNEVHNKFRKLTNSDIIKLKLSKIFTNILFIAITTFLGIIYFLISKDEGSTFGKIFSIGILLVNIYWIYKIFKIINTKQVDFAYDELVLKTKNKVFKNTDYSVTYKVYTEQSSKVYLKKFHLDESINLNDLFNTSIKIDKVNKLFYYTNNVFTSRIYSFKNIEDYEIYENNKFLYSYQPFLKASDEIYFDIVNDETKISELKIIISLDDEDSSMIVIPYIINFSALKKDYVFKLISDNLKLDTDKLDNLFDEIYCSSDKTSKEKLNYLKDLLNDDLIDNDEFDEIKNKILKL